MNIGNRNSVMYKTNRYQGGLAALEFIICLPVLLMLAVLLIDVSRAFIQYTEINKALQNGVRYAVVDTYGTLDFGAIADKNKIKNVVVYGTPSPPVGASKVLKYIEKDDVDIDDTTVPNEVTLSATYTYEPIFNTLPFTNNSLSFTIGASTKMRTAP
ncbi:TadE/TadG family type IV pilus assembly protein [Vibrio mytili]|nr:TadE family protein [Vibrio mytili]